MFASLKLALKQRQTPKKKLHSRSREHRGVQFMSPKRSRNAIRRSILRHKRKNNKKQTVVR